MKRKNITSILRATAILMLLACGTMYASAQYYMNVIRKDGSSVRFAVSEIEQVVLDGEEPSSEYEYVDLGLSVMWATCNVGAKTPYETGDFFAYGETTPKEKYTQENYKFTNADNPNGYTKYNFYSKYGPVDYKYRLDMEDDAARVNRGAGWRMPTQEEMMELVYYCQWEWFVVDENISGYLVTGPSGKSIFLIASGYRIDENHGDCTSYLSSSLYLDNYYGNAVGIDFEEDYYDIYPEARLFGEMIRPVFSADTPDNVMRVTHFGIMEDEVTLSVGENYKLHFDMDSLPINPLFFLEGNAVVLSEDGTIRAYAPGTSTITANLGEFTSQCSVTVSEPQIVSEAVDLGLSVKWATCNLGADSPEKDGYYYAWGETTPKGSYYWSNYQWYDYETDEFTKYNTNNNSAAFDGKTTLDQEDDAAHALWGGNWRMPSSQEFDELTYLCNWKKANVNGVDGFKVYSMVDGYEDNYIFIPITGYTTGSDLIKNNNGYYWSSSLYVQSNPQYAWCLNVYNSFNFQGWTRHLGRSVRPVTPSESWAGITDIKLSRENLMMLTESSSSLDVILMSGENDYSFFSGVEWSSSNPDAISVDEYGNLTTYLTTGEAVITARYNGLEASCVVSISQKTNLDRANEVLAQMKAYMPVTGNSTQEHIDFGYPSIMLFTDANGFDVVQYDDSYNWTRKDLRYSDRNYTSYESKMVWEDLYSMIMSSNSLISRLNNASNPQDKFALGEMYALRAFCYWNLAQLFQFNYAGNENKPCVPIITEQNADDAIANGCARSTVAQVYGQIQGDLNNAIRALNAAKSAGYVRSDKAQIDVSVAYGLRARVNLTMGEWAAAADDAQAAIDASGARPSSLAEASRPAFWTADESDWMWGVIVNEDDEIVESEIVNWISHMGSFNYGYAPYSGGRQINRSLFNTISGTDVRKGWWIDENSYSPNLTDEELEYMNDYVGYAPYTQVKFAAYNNVLYQDINANDIPLMRIEEMYLILAEGRAMSGASNAKSTLENFIRTYRDPEYVCPNVTGSDLQDEIWRQRRIELWGEGLSWFDIMRLGKDVDRRGAGYPDSYCVFNIPAGSDILLWRIPESEIESNPLISDDDNNPEAAAPEAVDDYDASPTTRAAVRASAPARDATIGKSHKGVVICER